MYLTVNIKKYCSILFLLVTFKLSAQHHVPLNSEYQTPIEKELITKKHNTSLKPLYKKDIRNFIDYDSTINRYYTLYSDTTKSWFNRKLLQENFIAVNSDNFHLTIDPVVILSLGKQQENSINTFRNTRALILEGSLGDKITFSSEFYENQAKFPDYVTTNINNTIVVPGQGVKRDFGDGGFDFNWAEGQIAFYPSQKITLEFGNGKHFIGNGYRSLLLSDNAFNYPYFKAIYSSERFFYSKIVMSLMHGIFDVNRSNVLYDRKTANIHYFGFNLSENIQLSFFEANIWASPDTTGSNNFSIGYINPIPFLNGIMDNSSKIKENNTSVGINLSVNLFQSLILYHQSLFDNFKDLKENFPTQYGTQNGIKYFDAFSIKNLFLQSEINIVQPYTYAKKNSEISYTHYNQALAHPLGANFIEGIFIAKYNYKRFGINYKVILAKYGADDQETNYGQNIFKSLETKTIKVPESTLLQGIKTSLNHNELFLTYLINPKTNLQFKIGFLRRNLTSNINSEETTYLYLSFESALKNFYYDF